MLEMKIARHAQIIKLINQYDIETQEELAKKLEESGFCRNAGDDFEGYPPAEAHKSTKKRTAEAAMRFCRTHRPRLGAAMRAC